MPSKGKLGACYQVKLFLVFLYLMRCSILSVTSQSASIAINSALNSTATLLSEGGVFEVGFTSGLRPNLPTPVQTLAIWYARTVEKKVVWVADRSMALSSNDQASLSLSALGELQVHSNRGGSPSVVWSSNTTGLNVTSVTIQDTGNLVLLNSTNQVVWQSFDSPMDTLLPNQSFSVNSNMAITAWQNDGDWSEGKYSLKWNFSQNLYASWQDPYLLESDRLLNDLRNANSNNYWKSESGNGFSYAILTPDGNFQAANATGSITMNGFNSSVAIASGRQVRLTLDKDGNLRIYSWSASSVNWTVKWEALTNGCFVAGFCGPYAICQNSTCTCPSDRFQFVDASDTRLGCQRKEPAAYCNAPGIDDTFVRVEDADWPNNDLRELQNVTFTECKQQCLADCECQAVETKYVNESTGIADNCWHKKYALNGRLLHPKQNQSTLSFIRVRPLTNPLPNPQHHVSRDLVIGAAVAILAFLSCALGSILATRKRTRKLRKFQYQRLQEKWVAAKGVLIVFTYQEIVLMTASFECEIGEGGYGTVFKGQIGNEYNSSENVTVAVKRLNKELTSTVEKEFLNEIDSIGLVHHVHLVSLLGYCSEANHRLLVYEYAAEGSLDKILFQEKKVGSPILEWRLRTAIAIQIARGLAYLHNDCKKRIVHCDVKPENILLDSSFNAKVADFGISRTMNRDKTRIKTMHICGTSGYLAPEWTSEHVRITHKVDVFSYGMVLLEIISGRRNLDLSRIPVDAPDMYFPMWAFPKIETEAFMDLVDRALTSTADPIEVRRALQVAFWCINEKPHVRPEMSEVVQMLQGHVAINLPVPRPSFLDTGGLESNAESCSTLHWSSEAGSNHALLLEQAGSSSDLTYSTSESSSSSRSKPASTLLELVGSAGLSNSSHIEVKPNFLE